MGPQHQGLQLNFGAWTQLVDSGLIEVLVNGRTQNNCQWNGNAGAQQYHQCQFTVGTNPGQWHKGAWVSLRAPRVHTSPIYVTWSGENFYPSLEAPCRLRKHIQHLIADLASKPGDELFGYRAKYDEAALTYQTIATAATFQDDDPGNDGQNPCVGNFPEPPSPPVGPSCPPDMEAIWAPTGDWLDFHQGSSFAGPSRTITGRLTPHPFSTWPQPHGFYKFCHQGCDPGHFCDLASNTCVNCLGNASSFCPDHDRFVATGTCEEGTPGVQQYLRARATLQTEVGVRDQYELWYCWSGPDNPDACVPNTAGANNGGFTWQGGGTALDYTLDVACQANQTFYLHLWVRSAGLSGNIPAIPEPAGVCNVYSLSYNIEQTADGYVPGFRHRDPMVPDVPPVNP